MSVSTTPAAIDAVNIAVGDVVLALEKDDPRRPALGLIQSGLDELYRIEQTRVRLDAALDRIGHQSSPVFRDRLAGAFEVTR